MGFLTGPNTVITRRLQGIDRPPAIPDALDDEFGGSALDAKWTWLDQGGAVAVVGNGRLEIAITETANRIRGIYQTAPAGAFTFQAKLSRPMTQVAAGSHSALFCGQGAGATDDQHGLAWWSANTHFAMTWASPSSAAAAWGPGSSVSVMQYSYYQLAWNGVNTLTVSQSKDGVVWLNFNSAVISYTPAIVGLGFSNATGDRTVHLYEWFRRVA